MTAARPCRVRLCGSATHGSDRLRQQQTHASACARPPGIGRSLMHASNTSQHNTMTLPHVAIPRIVLLQLSPRPTPAQGCCNWRRQHCLPCTKMMSWKGLLPISCSLPPKAEACSRNLPFSTRQCAAVTHKPSFLIRTMVPMVWPSSTILLTKSAASGGKGAPSTPGGIKHKRKGRTGGGSVAPCKLCKATFFCETTRVPRLVPGPGDCWLRSPLCAHCLLSKGSWVSDVPAYQRIQTTEA